MVQFIKPSRSGVGLLSFEFEQAHHSMCLFLLIDSRAELRYFVRQEVAMPETKLTIRLPRKLLENAKRYARKQNTTLTNLISEYLIQIPTPNSALENAPVVRRLSGTLSQDVSLADYKKHIEAKYAAKN